MFDWEDVTGIILPDHLAEVKLQNPEDHFKVGKFVNCRVLQIDTKHNKVLLTCKRVLVTSQMKSYPVTPKIT